MVTSMLIYFENGEEKMTGSQNFSEKEKILTAKKPPKYFGVTPITVENILDNIRRK